MCRLSKRIMHNLCALDRKLSVALLRAYPISISDEQQLIVRGDRRCDLFEPHTMVCEKLRGVEIEANKKVLDERWRHSQQVVGRSSCAFDHAEATVGRR